MIMKKITLTKSATPAAFCAGLCLAGGALSAQAQLTPAQADTLRDFFGSRAELGIILSGSDSIGGGNFTIDADNNDDIEYGLIKFGGSGEIGDPRALGDTGVQWAPYVQGVFGYLSGDNDITAGPLTNNDFKTDVFGVQFGGGVSFYLTERLKLTPSIGMIYGHYESELEDNTPAGTAAKPFLDVTLDSIGATPAVNLAYLIPLGNVAIELSTDYTLYATSDISDDDESNGIEAEGTTHAWENKVDVDVPLGMELWNCKLHTGGFVSHTALFGDITDNMSTDNFFTIHPRFVANTEGKLWRVSRLGLGASYFVGDNFSGWDVGIEFNFKF